MLPFLWPPPEPIAFEATTRAGISVIVGGVPVSRGSWFQYYEPDWSKGYYSSLFADQTITVAPDGTATVSFRSTDGRAFGRQLISKTEKGLRVDWEFGWQGSKPVKVELCAAALWAAPLESAKLFLDGAPSPVGTGPRVLSDSAAAADRSLGPDASAFSIQAPMGDMQITCSKPASLFDARGYGQPWALDRDLFWLGPLALDAAPGSVTRFSMEWSAAPKAIEGGRREVSLAASPMADVMLPHNSGLPLIPKPKMMQTEPGPGFELAGDTLVLDVPTGLEAIGPEFIRALKRRFEVGDWKVRFDQRARIILRLEEGYVPQQGYDIRVSPTTVVIIGADFEGLRNGLRTISQLVKVQNGKLYIPPCAIRDWPSVLWRGVQVFGGPDIVAHQTQIAERLLAPLKINKVVVQCERTNWNCLPGPANPQWTSRADLAETFTKYRVMGIEPIPLIQSFGHMEWYFMAGGERKLAVNPEIPYTLDFRKPAAVEALNALWAEACELLHPRTVHFGCDEVDRRGMQDDPAETTALWEAAMPFFGRISTRHQVKGIIWGDKGLAPGEAIDAALGDDKVSAQRRRTAVPKSFWIADWHYKNDPNPDRFMWSLNRWKAEGFWPIASGWFNSANIRGFSQAAYKAGSGYLQTTWAGHVHDDEAILREYRQFAAWVLAADYAWSGRRDPLSALEYDPGEVFAEMYFGVPSPLKPLPGTALEGFRTAAADGMRVRLGSPVALASCLRPGDSSLPTEAVIETPGLEGSMLALALDTTVKCFERDPVAQIEVFSGDKLIASRMLRYGSDVRAPSDMRAVPRGAHANGVSLIRLPLGTKQPVTRIKLSAASTYAGLRFLGASAY